MKPYGIIKSKHPLTKRYVIKKMVNPPKNIPLWFFGEVHTLPKNVEYVYEGGVENKPGLSTSTLKSG